MASRILKFGGTSIADADCIRRTAGIIVTSAMKDDRTFVVVSAVAGITQQLLELIRRAENQLDCRFRIEKLFEHHISVAADLLSATFDTYQGFCDELRHGLQSELTQIAGEGTCSPAASDLIVSLGERLSARLIAQYLRDIGLPANDLDARNCVCTDDRFGHAFVHYQDSYDRIRQVMRDSAGIPIITGFLGATADGRTTTLGRSGSDYSAAIFGAALNCDIIEIWTDVSGIFTADPGVVKDAVPIQELTYEEAMELAHAGAKIIFPPAMIPALYKKIPIHIRNTFQPDNPGTIISARRTRTTESIIGISSILSVSVLHIEGAGMVGYSGINARIFNALARKKISVQLVSQAFSEHSTCLAMNSEDADKGLAAVREEFRFELEHHYIDRIRLRDNLSLIAVVGDGLREQSGIAARIFSILGERSINVYAIAQGSSGRNLSFMVNQSQRVEALTSLHSEFISARTGDDSEIKSFHYPSQMETVKGFEHVR